MDTIATYARTERRTFAEFPFHAPDALVYALLSYDQFPPIVPQLPDVERRYGTLGRRLKAFSLRHPLASAKALAHAPYDGATLAEAEEWYRAQPDDSSSKAAGFINPKITHDFFRAAASNPRFADSQMNAALEIFSADQQTQFAAVTFRLPDGTLVVAFRGTDDTLVGWREDFNMAYQYPVPAQRTAADYLEKIGRLWDGPLILTGHSKGGNLAVYAAMNAPDDIQDRIEQIYSMDGPGFQQNVIESYEYSAIADRITKVVPELSIIGMLLKAPPSERRIVVTSQADGVMQHSGYTWQMDGDRFHTVPDIAPSSRTFNEAVNEWLAGMSQRQREHAVTALFRILESSGHANVSEIMHAGPGIIPDIVGSYVGLSGEDRKYINQAIRMLASAAFAHNPPRAQSVQMEGE